MKIMKPLFLLVGATTIFVLALAGCAPRIPDDKPYLEIKDGWARTLAENNGNAATADNWKTPVGPLGLGPNGLVFMVIDNKGGGADKLVKASSEVAEQTELDLMVLSGQQTYTYQVDGIDIPARTATELKSGAFYVRLINLKRELRNGDQFDVTLEFEQSGKQKIRITVANP